MRELERDKRRFRERKILEEGRRRIWRKERGNWKGTKEMERKCFGGRRSRNDLEEGEREKKFWRKDREGFVGRREGTEKGKEKRGRVLEEGRRRIWRRGRGNGLS